MGLEIRPAAAEVTNWSSFLEYSAEIFCFRSCEVLIRYVAPYFFRHGSGGTVVCRYVGLIINCEASMTSRRPRHVQVEQGRRSDGGG